MTVFLGSVKTQQSKLYILCCIMRMLIKLQLSEEYQLEITWAQP